MEEEDDDEIDFNLGSNTTSTVPVQAPQHQAEMSYHAERKSSGPKEDG